jgi:hypothetical protein
MSMFWIGYAAGIASTTRLDVLPTPKGGGTLTAKRWMKAGKPNLGWKPVA